MGGINVSLVDRDPNFFVLNPSLVGDTLIGFASASYQFYVADIGQALFTYALPVRRVGVIRLAVQHVRYGDMQGHDPTGAETNTFSAGQTALVASVAHQVGHFRMGVNVKPVFSTIAFDRSAALLFDVGGVFVHPGKELSVGLCVKNVGFVLADPLGNGTLPFDVQLGTTFKPEHMPIRFSISAYGLTSPDLIYYDPDIHDDEPATLAKVLSHINFGTEILFHRNVNLLLGYNYVNHRALRLERGGGGAGVTVGAVATIGAVDFVVARSGYVAGSASYTFTVSSDVNALIKSRKKL